MESVGLYLEWIAVSSALLGIAFAAWPLSISIHAFRDANKTSQAAALRYRFTRYLNLVSLLLTMTMLLLYLALEFRFFIQQDYYGESDYERITPPDLILLGTISIFKSITVYTYCLVVLDRYRIFKDVIQYASFALPLLHSFGLVCFLVSFVVNSLLFRRRIQVYTESPPWNFMKFSIQLYVILLDIFVTSQIVWNFFKHSNFGSIQYITVSESKKMQLKYLVALMILLDTGSILFRLAAFYIYPDIALVAQYIGENVVGFHLAVGLAILFQLKVASQSVSFEISKESHVLRISSNTTTQEHTEVRLSNAMEED